MPTEDASLSRHFHQMGREFGSTTGRARRCGWWDAMLARQSAIVNGIDEIAVTNLDGLDALPTIKLCVGYRLGKKKIDYIPNVPGCLARCQPIYAEFPGWLRSTRECRKWDDLPPNARHYLKSVEKFSKSRLRIVSVGPARDQTIELQT